MTGFIKTSGAKILLSLAIIFTSALASAQSLDFSGQMTQNLVSSLQDQAESQGLNWKIGDTCNYKLNMGFIQGKMKIFVREQVADGFWLEQNMDLGFLGKQKVEILLDPQTGAVKKILVNGEEQAPQEPGDMELIEMKEDKVTVPAGTFDAIYIKALDKKQNQEIQQWANPKLIPISGMIKTLSPSQMGQVDVQLVSFEKK